MKIKFIVVMLLMGFVLNAQEENKSMSKKERRKAKKELKQKERESFKANAVKLLEEKNFVMLIERAQNAKTGEFIILPQMVNFVKIDGENIAVQFADVTQLGLNGVGGVTYDGKLQKFEPFDRGEGKPAGVNIQYSSIYARNVITLYIEVNGEQVTARFNENGMIINLFGRYEAYEGSAIWEATNRRGF